MRTGWVRKRLGDICAFEGGSQPPKTAFSKVPKEGYVRLIQIRDYKSDENIVYIPRNQARRFCNERDIMIGRYGPPVFQILEGLRGAYNVALMKAIPNEQIIDRDFLFIFLKYSAIQDYIISLSERAAGQSGVNKPALEAYPIPVPPISEQKQIVAILNRIFSVLDKVKVNAEKNILNAKELFRTSLQQMFAKAFAQSELVTLSALCTDITDGDHLPPPKSVTGIPFITISNINKDTNKIDFSDTFKVPVEYFTNLKSNRKPQKGDVLFTVTGSYGIPVFIDSEIDFCFQRHIGLLRPNSQTDSEWLYYLIQSPQLQKQANEAATGTAQKTVSLRSLRNFYVPIVHISVQKAMVECLKEIDVKVKHLESIYSKKLLNLEELQKSLLQKAFNGELIPKELSVSYED